MYSGGIRVSHVKRNVNDSYGGFYEHYQYVTESGKSSGFLGGIPKYDYPYREVVNYGGTTTTDYTAVTSEPVATLDFAEGGKVGYSRVVVRRGTAVNGFNLGKEVQEFTDLRDLNTNVFTNAFPYTPVDIRSWGLGMPKRVSLYDSAGSLVKRTVTTYQYDSLLYDNDNFKSLKLGHSQTKYDGDPYNPSTLRTKTYLGDHYYLSTGRIFVTSSVDTLFHPNASYNATSQQLQYDTNYNVIKITTDYDRTRSLVKEQRMYYPYHYTVGGGVGKLRDSSIISQPVSTETWITGDGNPRIISALVTSYRQISSGDVKPDTIYAFESNKPVIQSTYGVFNAGLLNRNSTYTKPKTYFSAYDAKGNLSESVNLPSGQYSSILIDYDQQYAAAKVSNAAQADIAYTSFESTGSGNWTIGSASRDATDKMTGKKSYNLSNGNISKSSLSSGKQYLLTLWAKSGASVSVNSSSLSTSIASQQGWNLYAVNLTGITSVTISGSGLVDEVRLHPKYANMVTSTYEPIVGITCTTDANNTISYNEYDNLNRPMLVRDKDKNIIKRFQYTDSPMAISLLPVMQAGYKECRASNPGIVDSFYLDINPFSDSCGLYRQVQLPGYDCSCPGVSSLAWFKVVNGVCEIGTLTVVSSVYKKIDNVWVWECTHKYCFSDGSQSTWSSVSYHSSSCSITCFIEY